MEKGPRKPTQKRSLEKYERILDAAFKLFNEKGYQNITTADIAKEADVATGSVYSYFEDKKDIYLNVLQKVNDNISYPTKEFWEENKLLDLQDSDAVKDLFRKFLKLMLQYHNFSRTFHDDTIALPLLDKDIESYMKKQDFKIVENTKNVFDILAIPFKSEDDSDLFLHYCNLLIDDVCHRILYDETVKNIDLYIERVVEMLYCLFKEVTAGTSSNI